MSQSLSPYFTAITTDIHHGEKAEVLQLFPPDSRVHIVDSISSVLRARFGPPKTTKDLGTIRNHRIHYFQQFLHTMTIQDNWLLSNVPQERQHWQLALYAAHLATGHTLLCRSIKADTISKQLKHIADFHGRFGPDPRKTQSADAKISTLITGVINEVRRLEHIPHLREPHTIEMQEWLEATTTTLPNTHPKKAFADWARDGLYGGWWKSDWAQPEARHCRREVKLSSLVNFELLVFEWCMCLRSETDVI
jgi:hypothetical protein